MTAHGIVVHAPRMTEILNSSVSQPTDSDKIRDQARGALVGLAVGNLLGIPVEGATYSQIAASNPNGLTEINPKETHRPMDDDLAQAVELGHALLDGSKYARGFADRLVVWAEENGRGIGITTREVISKLTPDKPLLEPARTVYERKNRISPNGGVMRCAPVAIARHTNPNLLVSDSALTCAVTHYSPTCQWSCIIINAVIAELINGVPPALYILLEAAQADGCPDLGSIAQKDSIPADVLNAIHNRQPPPTGVEWLMCNHHLIGHTLLATQLGLWAATTPLDFESALVASVSVGGDTDTNGAVAGAVLGARYGLSAIPGRWSACVPQRERIVQLADDLLAFDTTEQKPKGKA